MNIAVDRYHAVRDLGYAFHQKPRIIDRDGRNIGYRRLSAGYEDQKEIITRAQEVTVPQETILLIKPGFRRDLDEPTLTTLGLELRAPESDDGSEDPLVAAVRLKELLPGLEVTDVVDKTRLREGDYIAIGVPEERDGHRTFVVDHVLTRRKGVLGSSHAEPLVHPSVGA